LARQFKEYQKLLKHRRRREWRPDWWHAFCKPCGGFKRARAGGREIEDRGVRQGSDIPAPATARPRGNGPKQRPGLWGNDMMVLTIRNKLWLSFGILVVLLVAVGLMTVANLRANEKKLVELVNEVQPAVVQSLNLVDQLDRASAALGFYLLSKEDLHRQEYLLYLAKITDSMAALKAMPLIQRDPATLRVVTEADGKIRKLESFKDHMLVLAVDRGKNIPAMKFAGDNVNPKVQILLQSLFEILSSEQSEKATPERKQFTLDVANLRHLLLSAVNELRLFLAFRGDEQYINYQTFRDSVDESVKRLAKYAEMKDFLTFEQEEAFANFNREYKAYFKAADQLLQIHKGEGWRQDAYIIRKQIAPLLLQVQTQLNKMVAAQQDKSVSESEALTRRATQIQLVVMVLLGVGLLSAMVIGFLLSRAINNPISALKASAAELARGNLDEPIDTRRNDELGSLAMSFADMRDSIRKKIADLHVLNGTGEELAGHHSQVAALQTAMRVMHEQTRVDWGSVYLFNEESQMLEIRAYYPERPEMAPHRAKSFRLGEGVAGKAAQEKRVLYIPDSSQDTGFVAGEEPARARAVICVPMTDEGKVFGVMNFSGEVGTVKFEASDAEFAETIARMTVVTSKNIQMLNVIEEQNRTLENKVQERTAQLRQKTNDINSMLQNMHQGIFTIHGHNAVHHEYSAYLETILGTGDVAGRDAMQLLFTDSNLTANTLDQIKASLAAILGEDAMMYDFNKHLLVKEYSKKTPDGQHKVLELDWDPIKDEHDVVEKMMVTVRDVTELRQLQAEARQQKWELEVIGQILAVSRQKFQDFVKTALAMLAENEATIRATEAPTSDVIGLLFRNMHTIKGNARTYAFHAITDRVHEAENVYDRLRRGQSEEWAPDHLIADIMAVRDLVETYDRIYRTKLASNEADGLFVDLELVELGKKILAEVDDNDHGKLRFGMARVRQLINAIGTETIPSVLEGIIKSMPEIASRLGKEAPQIVVKDNHFRLVPDAASVLKNVFTHEFRNAVDHGLESPSERAAQGKPARGTITLEAVEDRDHLLLKLYDDGRGLVLEKIRERAVEKGLIPADARLSDEQVADLIFCPGLSTADNVSDVSGRGVGMDAVRKFVTALGGRIELRLRGRRRSAGPAQEFEAHITLPRSAYVKVA
jgi:putative methionine-R-sulfoxide reductase with GAF domain/CHASE3 domain sensor protein/HPt (histidine-containing phosphotransfer) domain-containing protein